METTIMDHETMAVLGFGLDSQGFFTCTVKQKMWGVPEEASAPLTCHHRHTPTMVLSLLLSITPI